MVSPILCVRVRKTDHMQLPSRISKLVVPSQVTWCATSLARSLSRIRPKLRTYSFPTRLAKQVKMSDHISTACKNRRAHYVQTWHPGASNNVWTIVHHVKYPPRYLTDKIRPLLDKSNRLFSWLCHVILMHSIISHFLHKFRGQIPPAPKWRPWSSGNYLGNQNSSLF